MLGLVRTLQEAGLRVAVFKPVSEDLCAYEVPNGYVSLSALHLMAAADISPCGEVNPVLSVPTLNNQTEIWLLGRYLGTVSRLGRDMPLLDELPISVQDEIEQVTWQCLEKIGVDADVVIVEGSGGASDLTILQAWDLANVTVARRATAAILIARASNGGAIASLAGTVSLLDEEVGSKVRGLGLSDVCHRQKEILVAGEDIARKIGKTYLGAVPYLALPKKWQQQEPDSSEAEENYLNIATAFKENINIAQLLEWVGL